MDAELYEFDPVQLTYQFADLTEVNAARSTYTQTFRVPLTERNSDIFGAVNSLASVTNYDIKKRMPARLMEGGVTLVSGYVQIKRFIKQKGRYLDVEITFFGESANLSRALGDAMISDLDLSAYNLTTSAANVQTTWGSGQPIRFGVVDRGQNWAGSTTWAAAQTGLQPTDLTGFIDVYVLLQEIFDQNGLTFQSDFFDGLGDKLYMMLNAGGKVNKYTDVADDVLFNVGLTSNLTFSNTTYTAFNYAETGSFFDPGNNVSAGVFTAPYTGNYQFKVRVKFATIPATGQVDVILTKNGAYFTDVLSLPVSSISTAVNYLLFTPFFTLNAGDTIDVRYKTTAGTGSFVGSGLTNQPTTNFELYSVQLTGAIYDVAANAPEIKQIEFLMGLQRMFNLVFIPDPNIANHFYIEPFADYVAFGNTIDWTEKLALDKDVVIAPTSDIQKRKYLYNMATGGDFISTAIVNSLGRAYGQMEIRDTGNDFAVGEEVIQSPFASFIACPVPQTDFPILREMNQDTTPIDKPKPRLAFWNGKITLGNWYFAGVLQSEFPTFTECEKFIPTIDAIDLNFGYDPKFRYVPAHSRDALWWRFWYPLTGELYSRDARTMEAYFKLNPQDIVTFSWANRVFIENALWRVLSMEYTANDPTALTRVTLLKIVPPEAPCAFIPHQILKSGQVTFMHSTGVVSTPSRECCELFGYRHDPINSTCWGTLPLQTPKTYPEEP